MTVATADDLRSRIEKMTQQLEAIQGKERAEALKTARDLVARYGFEASELGLGTGARRAGKKQPLSRVREERSAKYRDPKSGATWNGWGKPPHWMPKDKARREKYLIAAPAAAKPVDSPAPAVKATKKAAPAKKISKAPAAKKAASKKAPKAAAEKRAPAKKAAKNAVTQAAEGGSAAEAPAA
jgi:DNA-binding protein H-NS